MSMRHQPFERANMFYRKLVGPEDIASTITTYLGIKPPSGSTGKALTEVLNNAKQ